MGLCENPCHNPHCDLSSLLHTWPTAVGNRHSEFNHGHAHDGEHPSKNDSVWACAERFNHGAITTTTTTITTTPSRVHEHQAEMQGNGKPISLIPSTIQTPSRYAVRFLSCVAHGLNQDMHVAWTMKSIAWDKKKTKLN